jgi:hypothetical protein
MNYPVRAGCGAGCETAARSNVIGRTARLVPELHRYFVAVPQHETTSAEILVFEVH